MGTSVSVDIADGLPADRLDTLAGETFGWLHEVDRLFSTYKPDSQISLLQAGSLELPDASPVVRGVLERCAELWQETSGYFDVYATGPLDPSGYVKGWSVQVASDRLTAAGAANHCVNAGGDIRLRGVSSGDTPWRVGIKHPFNHQALCWVLAGTDLGVATSGIYERGEHVVDPLRGEAATVLRSVTVVGPDLGTADAYATAALAMGLGGLEWLAELAATRGYESAVVTDAGEAYATEGLPVAPRS